jgi:hypothetical protein
MVLRTITTIIIKIIILHLEKFLKRKKTWKTRVATQIYIVSVKSSNT